MGSNLRTIGWGVFSMLVLMAGSSRDSTASTVKLNARVSLQMAQAEASLTERADFIGSCRGSGATALTLYEDSRRTRAVGTIPAGVVVTLTGVVGEGVVLIRNPSVGWIQSATLTTNCESGQVDPGLPPLPPDLDTNPAYCRRLRSLAIDGSDFRDLDAGLPAFSIPGGALQTYPGGADGPSRAAVVRITRTPPESQNYDGRTWIRVSYPSQLGIRRVGWISNGQIGTNRNLGYCLPGQT